MDQEAGDLIGVGNGLNQLLLSGPGRGRVLGEVEMDQPQPARERTTKT